jgi:hypothetical protein
MALDVTALNDFNNEVAGELVVKSVYGGLQWNTSPSKKV